MYNYSVIIMTVARAKTKLSAQKQLLNETGASLRIEEYVFKR